MVVPRALLDLGEPLSGLFALLLGCAEGIVGLPGCVRELFGDFDERSDVSECELVQAGGVCEQFDLAGIPRSREDKADGPFRLQSRSIPARAESSRRPR